MSLSGGPHWPGVPAWPITKPVRGPTNVAEVGWKFGGAAGGAVGVVDDDADGSDDGEADAW